MNRIERLSRNQRKKIYGHTKAKIALGLCLLLLAMVIINNQWDFILDILPDSIVGTYSETEFYTAVDSLVVRIDKEFGFNKHIQVGSGGSESEVSGAKLYQQPWPINLPYLFYSKKINEYSKQLRIDCDCVESQKNKQLICVLKPKRSDFDLRAVIYVSSQRSTKFTDKKVGFILANITNLGKNDLLKLVEEDVIFSYFADIETFPSGNLKKSLKKGGISAIFDLPLEESKLDRFSRSEKRNKKLSQSELAEKMLAIHPNTEAINLIRTEEDNIEFARAIFEKAGNNQIKYVYNSPPPDIIDSLAYSYGLKIIEYDSSDFNFTTDMKRPEVNILNNLIDESGSVEYLIVLDTNNISINSIISLAKTLKSLGIKQLQGIKLYKTVELL